MKLTRLNVIAAIIFLAVLAIAFTSCKKAPARVEETERTKKKAVKPQEAPKQAEEERFIYASHDKRDPFVPLVDRYGRPVSVVEGGIQFKISDMYLEGIIWDNEKPMAIINSEVVWAGNKVKGVTVEKIERDKVILSYQNETFELKIE